MGFQILWKYKSRISYCLHLPWQWCQTHHWLHCLCSHTERVFKGLKTKIKIHYPRAAFVWGLEGRGVEKRKKKLSSIYNFTYLFFHPEYLWRSWKKIVFSNSDPWETLFSCNSTHRMEESETWKIRHRSVSTVFPLTFLTWNFQQWQCNPQYNRVGMYVFRYFGSLSFH